MQQYLCQFGVDVYMVPEPPRRYRQSAREIYAGVWVRPATSEDRDLPVGRVIPPDAKRRASIERVPSTHAVELPSGDLALVKLTVLEKIKRFFSRRPRPEPKVREVHLAVVPAGSDHPVAVDSAYVLSREDATTFADPEYRTVMHVGPYPPYLPRGQQWAQYKDYPIWTRKCTPEDLTTDLPQRVLYVSGTCVYIVNPHRRSTPWSDETPVHLDLHVSFFGKIKSFLRPRRNSDSRCQIAVAHSLGDGDLRLLYRYVDLDTCLSSGGKAVAVIGNQRTYDMLQRPSAYVQYKDYPIYVRKATDADRANSNGRDVYVCDDTVIIALSGIPELAVRRKFGGAKRLDLDKFIEGTPSTHD